MRFKKGTKVEVLNKREVPSGSWWCAEIISGNGHSYKVKYGPSPAGMSALVERVPRKVLRPCPPLVQGCRSWVTGDIVEVFDNNSWKLSEVSNVLGGNYFFVRLLGSSTSFKVHKSDLRVRQSWQDNRWSVIGKDVMNSDNRKLLKEGCRQKLNCQRTQSFVKVQNCVNKTVVEEPHRVSSGDKRGLQLCSSAVETCHRVTKKPRAGEKEGGRQQLASGKSYRLREKVDAVASPQTMLGEKYMHTSLNNRTGLSEMFRVGGNPNGDVGCFFARSLQPNDTSSVCSSSGSNDPDMLHHYLIPGPNLDRDSLSDDAESSCWPVLRVDQSVPTKKDLAQEIRKFELYAYHSTMVALYSSGPISWEQEELMTNLRLMLNISNDEHLLQLRHLTSAKSDLLSYLDATPGSS